MPLGFTEEQLDEGDRQYDEWKIENELEKQRKALQRKIVAEQQPGSQIDYFFCPFCKVEFPIVYGALHEAFYKRSDNVPDHITHSEQNCAVLCSPCHGRDGQTKQMTQVLLEHKMRFFDVYVWIRDCMKKEGVNHRPTSIQELNERDNEETNNP